MVLLTTMSRLILHSSAAIDINTDHLDSKPVSTRQARIANLQRQIESLEKKLMRLEEDFGPEEDNESYEGTVRRRRHLAKIFGEHLSVYRMTMHLPLHLGPHS